MTKHRLQTVDPTLHDSGWYARVVCSCGKWEARPETWQLVPGREGVYLGYGQHPHIQTYLKREWARHVSPPDDTAVPASLVATLDTGRVKYEYWVYHGLDPHFPKRDGRWWSNYGDHVRRGGQYARHPWAVFKVNSAGPDLVTLTRSQELAISKALQRFEADKALKPNATAKIYRDSEVGAEMSLVRFVADFLDEYKSANTKQQLAMLDQLKDVRRTLDVVLEDVLGSITGSLDIQITP